MLLLCGDMSILKYSKEHIDKLRKFFSEPERNQKIKEIMDAFPDFATMFNLKDDEVIKLHLQVIEKLLWDIYLSYRINLMKWSEVTRQSAIVDPEFLSMHLISIFTGIPGTGTAARGLDLSDGSEVKSCSRAEQLGRCKRCGNSVMPFEEKCGGCGSRDIERKFDSHWIFSLRSEEEVRTLLSTPSIYLVLFDYEDIEKRDTIRVRIWMLDPKDKFVQVFFREYYFEEYYKKKISEGKTPAPCNLHPEKPLTKSLRPRLLFVAKVHPYKSKVMVEYVNSSGEVEKISSKEARTLLSERKEFFRKIIELGLDKEYKQQIEEICEETKNSS